MEDSDHYELFSDDERAEFLFRVFSHIVLGGPVNQVRKNKLHVMTKKTWMSSKLLHLPYVFSFAPYKQYEDDIGPYLDTSKMFYKELVT